MSKPGWKPRVLRWAVALVAAVWAVALLGLIVFWIRSAFVADVVTRTRLYSNASERGNQSLQLVSERGLLLLQSSDDREPQDALGGTFRWMSGPRDQVRWGISHTTVITGRVVMLGYSSGGGFTWRTSPQKYPASYWQRSISAPYWAVLAALLLPGIVAFPFWRRASRRRQRVAEGLCVKCGYDLRASLDRCPECGMPFNGKFSPVDAGQGAPADAGRGH